MAAVSFDEMTEIIDKLKPKLPFPVWCVILQDPKKRNQELAELITNHNNGFLSVLIIKSNSHTGHWISLYNLNNKDATFATFSSDDHRSFRGGGWQWYDSLGVDTLPTWLHKLGVQQSDKSEIQSPYSSRCGEYVLALLISLGYLFPK